MLVRPPLSEAPRYPISALIMLAAIGVSAWWWTGHSIDRLVPTSATIVTEPWTLVTSIFPHVSVIHLLFNVLWCWLFATTIERVWGWWRLTAVVLVLAVISSAAEFAVEDGGVGLSGVGYGLCTLIYIAQRRYEALQGVATRKTLELFAVWFVICIVLTITGLMRIGNVAHGAGAAAGALMGMMVVAEPRRRWAWVVALAGLLGLAGAGATVARPWVNVSQWIGDDGLRGYTALQEGRNDDAVRLLEGAAKKKPNNAYILVNLGIAYQRKERYDEALDAFTHAVQIDSSRREKLGPGIAWLLDRKMAEASKRGDINAVKALAGEALGWKPDDVYAKEALVWAKKAEEESKKGDGKP